MPMQVKPSNNFIKISGLFFTKTKSSFSDKLIFEKKKSSLKRMLYILYLLPFHSYRVITIFFSFETESGSVPGWSAVTISAHYNLCLPGSSDSPASAS